MQLLKIDFHRVVFALGLHQKADAAITIAVMPVPWEEASRFGIMSTNEAGEIIEFAEKPEKPKSNLASMGIYIFKYDVLKKYLTDDERDPNSENDFGKNIIPKMLENGEKLMSYTFEGYWKDVGTIQSLWEANMDLIDDPPKFELSNKRWVIYSRNYALMPQYIGENAAVKNSTITEGCEIDGEIDHSVIFSAVKVGKGAVVKDSVILPGAEIGDGAVIEKSVIGSGAKIGANAKVGVSPASDSNPYASKYCTHGIVLIEGGAVIDDNADIIKESMVTINS